MENDILQQLTKLFEDQIFEVRLTNNKTAKFKHLTTIQLTKLVETVVDSPITQAVFSSTVSDIMLKNSKDLENNNSFNIIDRTLFLLDTRIQTLGKTQKIIQNSKTVEINFEQIKNSLYKVIESKSYIFEDHVLEKDGIKLTYGIPLVVTDYQLNTDEYLKGLLIIENVDQLRKVLGEMFINEIAKSLKTISINGGTERNLSKESFQNRKKIIEFLPATIIKDVVSYIESYKKDIEDCYISENNVVVSMDGTMFSLQ